MTEYNKSNLEILLNTALSNPLMDLDPLKNSYSNRNLTRDRDFTMDVRYGTKDSSQSKFS